MPDIPTPETVIVKGSAFTSPSILKFEKEYRWKLARIFLFSLLAIAAAAATGWTLNNAFSSAAPRHWLWFAIAFFLWLGMVSITSLILSWKANIVVSIAAGGLILYPYWNVFPLYIVAALAAGAGLGFFIAGAEMRQKHGAMLRVEMRSITKAGLPFLIFILSLLVACVYYLQINHRIEKGEFLVSEDTIKATLKSSVSMVRPFVPGFHEDITIGDLVGTMSLTATQNSLEDFLNRNPAARNLPQTELNRIQLKISQEAQKEVLANLSGKVGMNLTGKETISRLMYTYLADWYQKLPAQARKVFVAVWIALAFFAAWSVGYLSIIAAPFVAWVLFQFFHSLKLVKINKIPAEKEVMTL